METTTTERFLLLQKALRKGYKIDDKFDFETNCQEAETYLLMMPTTKHTARVQGDFKCDGSSNKWCANGNLDYELPDGTSGKITGEFAVSERKNSQKRRVEHTVIDNVGNVYIVWDNL